jgi:hypothetical protein
MSDLKKDAAHWRDKITELVKVIYQVKDGALRSPFGEDAKWHEKLSHVSAELGLSPLGCLASTRQSNGMTNDVASADRHCGRTAFRRCPWAG